MNKIWRFMILSIVIVLNGGSLYSKELTQCSSTDLMNTVGLTQWRVEQTAPLIDVFEDRILISEDAFHGLNFKTLDKTKPTCFLIIDFEEANGYIITGVRNE